MKNIFQIGGQVTGESFIGRKKFVNDFRKDFIENDIRTAKSIIGLTRMGKTSTILKVFENCPQKIIYVYSILKEYSNYNEIWQDICYKIRKQLAELNIDINSIKESFDIVESDDIKWIKMLTAIKNIFSYLSDMELKTVLVLDEFDSAKELFEEKTKHFELFRTVFSDAKFNVSAITISRRNLYTIEGATYQSSTFHGVLDVIPFKGFDEDDMKEYFDVFEKVGISLNNSQKNKIIYYAGNIPFLLSIIGHYIFDSFEADEDIDIDKIFQNKCKSINDYYRDCIKHLERDNELKRIIPFILGPNIGVTHGDKQELFNLGYFREVNGNLIAVSEYFTDFLSVNMLNISIWDEIINLEKKMKQLIELEFTKIVKHYSIGGNDFNEIFLNVLTKTPGIEQGDIAKYKAFLSKTTQEFNNIQCSYLDVISMGDSIKIIKDCWIDIFAEYFNNAKFGDYELKFQRCVRARNPIAHGHEDYLTLNDKNEVNIYCKEIFEVINRNAKNVKIDSENYLDVAKKFMTNLPQNQEIEAKIVNMKIEKIGKKGNLKGTIILNNKKYEAVIPKNYLQNVKLQEKIGHTVKVKVNPAKQNNDIYEVEPQSLS